MPDFCVVYTPRALKYKEQIRAAGLTGKVKQLENILKINPFQTPPPYEKLCGNLSGCYSRRINIQHRLVYEVFKEEKIVKILSMWTHYEQ